MIDHQIYSFIYIFLTWVLTLVQSERIKRMPDLCLYKRNNYSKAIVFFMIFLIFLMGFRPFAVGVDTGQYIKNYNLMMSDFEKDFK